MNNVVRFENSRRKLNWKQEEEIRESKKGSRKRRDERKTGRNAKWATEGDEE